MALTDTAIRQAKPKEKAYTIPDTLGLAIYVAPSGVKSWHFRFTWLGKQARISLGTYPAVGLKDARLRRDEAREEVAKGIDPRDSRKERKTDLIQAQGHTLRSIYTEWLEFRRPTMRPGSIRIISNAMELDWLPTFGDRQIGSITRSEIISMIRRIEKRGAVTTAVKTRQRLGQIFKYAIAIGVIESNPTAEMHMVTEKMGRHRHFPFLPFDQLAGTMAKVHACGAGIQPKSAFMLMLYCASRPGEVRNSMWSEIDFDCATWTIPAEKMKMRRDHIVPLPEQAIEVLRVMRALTGHCKNIFTHRNDSTRPINTNFANSVIEQCGLTGIQSPHGFRHLFSTEMNNRGYHRDWIERQLAHADVSVIRDTYNHASYLEQRRAMMQEWADLVTPRNQGKSPATGSSFI